MPALHPLLQAHYGRADLTGRLFDALRTAGVDPERLTRDAIAPFEEFHTRGRDATRELADLAGLRPGMAVLDVGCGIGGPARTLAAEYGCHVTGLDVVEAYCHAAAALTERVGLGDTVTFVQGDALALPFEPARFDAAVLEHVTMNVEDKDRLFAELARVLRPGGRLALFEIAAGPDGPIHFPVPWAGDTRLSFLVPPEALRASAERAGFAVRVWRDVSEDAQRWFAGMVVALAAHRAAPPLGLHLLMGPETPQKVGNLLRNLEEDRVRVVQAVLDRPEGNGDWTSAPTGSS